MIGLPRRLAVSLLVFFGLPLLGGFAAYRVLAGQHHRTWLNFMPAAAFTRPEPGPKYLVLTRADDFRPFSPALFSFAFRGNDFCWLMLRENIAPKTLVTKNRHYAVSADGRLSRQRSDHGNPVFDLIAGVPGDLQPLLDHSVLLAEDADLLREMQTRFPPLRNGRHEVLLFADAFSLEACDAAAVAAPGLDGSVAWRLAALIGIVLAAAALIWAAAPGAPAPLRTALVMLAAPLAASIWVSLVLVVGSHLSPVFPVLPFVLWLALGGAAAGLSAYRPKTSLLFDGVGRFAAWIHERPGPRVLFGTVAAIVLAWFAYLIPNSGLTASDAQRYLDGARSVARYGRWPIDEFVAAGKRSSTVTIYPPGPSILIATGIWAVGPDLDTLYRPGIQTGSIWRIYGTIAVLLHLGLELAVMCLARAWWPRTPSAWILAGAAIIIYVPSAHGMVFGAETLLWPLFAAALVALAVWRSSGVPAAGCMAAALAGGATLMKPEAGVMLAALAGPWALTGLPLLRGWFRNGGMRGAALLACAAAGFAGPMELVRLHQVNGIVADPDFRNPSLTELVERPTEYLASLRLTTRVFTGPLGSRNDPETSFMVHHALPAVLVMMVLLAYLQVRHFSWRRLCVPLGLAAYFFGFPAIYLFSHFYTGTESHILLSWNRLVVPFVITTVIYTLVLAAEAARLDEPDLRADRGLPPK